MPDTKKKTVLIIDDDRFLLNMYSVKLKSSGFNVDTVVSGLEALSKLREGVRPDVILLDMVMPSMDGLELLENFRKENFIGKSKIIVLSNQNQPGDIERAKTFGIASYIVKASSIPSDVVNEVLKITS